MSEIDFSKLSLQDALDVAILIEEEASERYGELAAQLELHHTAEAATFFRHMVNNEKHHAEALKKRREALFGDAPRTVSSAIVPEIEAPDYEAVRAFMSPHQALNVAMVSETRARDFYAKALGAVDDKSIVELFTDLLDEEKHHITLVQKELDKLPPEDPIDPDDVVDPPVGL